MAVEASFFPSAGLLSMVGGNLDDTIVTSRDAAGQIPVSGGAVPLSYLLSPLLRYRQETLRER